MKKTNDIIEEIVDHTPMTLPDPDPDTDLVTVEQEEIPINDVEDIEYSEKLLYHVITEMILGNHIDTSLESLIEAPELKKAIRESRSLSYTRLKKYFTPEYITTITQEKGVELIDNKNTFANAGAYYTFIIPEELSELGEVGSEYTIYFPTTLEVHTQYKALYDDAVDEGIAKGLVPVKGGGVILTTEISKMIPKTILYHRYRAEYKLVKYQETLKTLTTPKDILALKWEDKRTKPDGEV